MNDNSGDRRGPRGRPRPRRPGLLAAVAGIAMLAAACGGPRAAGPAASSAQTGAQVMDAYVACMRAHGTVVFAAPMNHASLPPPDVPLYGSWTVEGGDPSSPDYQTASKACLRLVPTATPQSAGQLHQLLSASLKGAACMRSHGYPSFPDPTAQDGDIGFEPLPASIDTSSPQYQAALRACRGGGRP